jgi:hypothetical protein
MVDFGAVRVVRAGRGWRLPALAGIAGVLVLLLPCLSVVGPTAAATEGDVTVLVRIEGPADQSTFRDTGEYFTIWSGEVVVPRELTVTAHSGEQYRLYVEGGRYLATRLSDGRISDLGEGDDTLGATSVLAALHQASLAGGFSYRLSDAYFPSPGFFLSGIDDYIGSGSKGWSYRVWSGDAAPCPSDSIDRFLLGYDSMTPPAPHPQVIFFWGYGTDCRVLRVVPESDVVQCGEPLRVGVECFADSGYSGEGTWEPVPDAQICAGDECCVTGDDGFTDVVFDETGTFALTASAGHDGEYYYIPSDATAEVTVEGECRIISFTIVDRGGTGLDFGLALCGAEDLPEEGQTADHGAVRLEVGSETTVDCELQLRASVETESAGGIVLPIESFSWSTGPSAAASTPMTSGYVTAGTAQAGSSTTLEVWHWLTVPADQAPAAYSGAFCYRAVADGS